MTANNRRPKLDKWLLSVPTDHPMFDNVAGMSSELRRKAAKRAQLMQLVADFRRLDRPSTVRINAREYLDRALDGATHMFPKGEIWLHDFVSVIETGPITDLDMEIRSIELSLKMTMRGINNEQ